VRKKQYSAIVTDAHLAQCAVPDHDLGKLSTFQQVVCHSSSHDSEAQEANSWARRCVILCLNHFAYMWVGAREAAAQLRERKWR
jgi:hypothetical protein